MAWAVTAILLFVVILANPLFAQPDTAWVKTYGMLGGEFLSDAVRSQNGGYILGGAHWFYDDQNIIIMKVDANWDLSWMTEIDAGWRCAGTGVSELPNRSIIATGYNMDSTNTHHGYGMMLSAEGDSTWIRPYGGIHSYLNSALSTNEGNAILAGYTAAFAEHGGGDAYLVQIDQDGEIISQNSYGGRGNEEFNTIAACADGGYALAGRSGSFGRGLAFYLVKVDSTGEEEWSNHYYYHDNMDLYCFEVTQTLDGGFAVIGRNIYMRNERMTMDMVAARVNAQGDLFWIRSYGGNGHDEGYAVAQLDDGSFVLGGKTGSFGRNADNVYLVRVDPDGEILWSTYYDTPVLASQDVCNKILVMEDRSYLLAGSTDVMYEDLISKQFALFRATPDTLRINDVKQLDPAYPSLITLDTPYPNPLNSSSTIAYSLSLPSAYLH